MKKLKFGKLTLGGVRTVIIAEIADSHNGSIKTAKKLVDAAKEVGADVAKFQLHLPDMEMVPNSIQMWDGSLYDILKRNLFSKEMHMEIKKYCESIGIEYLCTPFCPDAVGILEEIGVKAYKTGSGELTNLPMQRKLAKLSNKTGKPVIVSTGMSNWNEIIETVSIYKTEDAKDNLVLTNCTSEYPPNDYSHANLGLIKKLREECAVIVGQSDHTIDNYTAFAAVALGAKLVEKHFTLSRNQKGPDHKIALEPQMFKELVEGIRKIEIGLGNERIVSTGEQVVRDWAHHSVVTSREIKAGEPFSSENLMPKRPGSGIEAKYLDKLYADKLFGKISSRDLPVDTILSWEDVV